MAASLSVENNRFASTIASETCDLLHDRSLGNILLAALVAIGLNGLYAADKETKNADAILARSFDPTPARD
jgi:hypothetical protein